MIIVERTVVVSHGLQSVFRQSFIIIFDFMFIFICGSSFFFHSFLFTFKLVSCKDFLIKISYCTARKHVLTKLDVLTIELFVPDVYVGYGSVLCCLDLSYDHDT